jgi:hypothetical protein
LAYERVLRHAHELRVAQPEQRAELPVELGAETDLAIIGRCRWHTSLLWRE